MLSTRKAPLLILLPVYSLLVLAGFAAAPGRSFAAPTPPTEKALIAALELQLDAYVAFHLQDSKLEEAQFKCERESKRRHECIVSFKASASRDIYIDDAYGDETMLEKGEQMDCGSYASAVRIGGWSSRGYRYRVKFDKPECERIDPYLE